MSQPKPSTAIVIRLTKEEREFLKTLAATTNLSLNCYCRSELGLPPKIPKSPKTLLEIFTESPVDSEI